MSRVGRPPLFPCADRVMVPQVGADLARVSSAHHYLNGQGVPLEALFESKVRFSADYLKRISGDLTFSEDVVRTHAVHSLPYDRSKPDNRVFRFERTPRKKKSHSDSLNKLQAKGFEKKHLPCNIHQVSEHKLRPLKVPKFRLNRENREELVLESSDCSTETKSPDPVFLTESHLEKQWSDISLPVKGERPPHPSDSKLWDAQVLQRLSKNTARWIVSEKTTEGSQKERLDRLMDDLHGVPSGPIDTLIRDDASISDLGVGDSDMLTPSGALTRNRRRTASSGVGEIVEDGTETAGAPLRGAESEPLVSFYRLPFGLRKAQREVERKTAKAMNTTAEDIKIYRRKARPPPTLRDVMNPAVGDKMYDTANQYEQEWLSGSQQVQKADRSGQVLMDSGNAYQTFRQQSYPINPDTWCSEGNKARGSKKRDTSDSTSDRHPQIVTKGRQKWSKLPEAVQEEVMSVHETSYKPERQRRPSFSTTKNHRENSALVRIVDEWRSKWNLSNKWYDSSIEDLERDLADLNEHVRLQAVATIARASTFRPVPESSTSIEGSIPKLKRPLGGTPAVQSETEGILPGRLIRSVERALEDPSHRVRFTAAMTLYTLNRPNVEARDLLNTTLRTGTPPEKWAAAQCLAHAGVCDSYIVGELVNQLFNTEDVVRQQQCITLMSGLSEVSTIVHSLVAEQLNSTSWRRRIMACKVLPSLHGAINKDITHKLTTLMWQDWHSEVRTVAAQTLGRTGHGKVVHNDLRERLTEGNERDRIDALHKIGHLGIMTARLLPSYLTCFDDAYISVRVAATNTAAELQLKEDKVLNRLLRLTQFDSNWKVKAHALKALGMIGALNDRIADTVVWALRFEAEPGVRAEACETLVRLEVKSSEISSILQDKLLVEPDPTVKRQLMVALEAQGVSSSGDMEMVHQIKDEVRRLCTRLNIAAKIAENEEWEAKQENHRELFDSSPRLSEFEKKHEQRPSRSEKRPSTRLSQRTTTPMLVVTSDDEEGSIDVSLPQTPTSHATGGMLEGPLVAGEQVTPYGPMVGWLSLTPEGGGIRSGSSRLTPAEKLEKLIEVYEGTCSYHEYEQYVRPGEESGGGSQGPQGSMRGDTSGQGCHNPEDSFEGGGNAGAAIDPEGTLLESPGGGRWGGVKRRLHGGEKGAGTAERDHQGDLGTALGYTDGEDDGSTRGSHVGDWSDATGPPSDVDRCVDHERLDSAGVKERAESQVEGVSGATERLIRTDDPADSDRGVRETDEPT